MKPLTRNTNKGRTVSVDDIHHKTNDTSPSDRKASAKAQKHGNRQEAQQEVNYSIIDQENPHVEDY